ncbi:MAG: RHS repeat-associated core domain-containing protein [Ethanoligenens sp.]
MQTDSNGLYYMRARYYSATLKRFVNADVKKGSIQTSESLNRHVYANGSPVNNIDLFWKKLGAGECFECFEHSC